MVFNKAEGLGRRARPARAVLATSEPESLQTLRRNLIHPGRKYPGMEGRAGRLMS